MTAPTVPDADAQPRSTVPRPGVALTLGAAVLGAAMAGALVGTHALTGPPALAMLVLALGLQPLGRSLSGRVIEGVMLLCFGAGLLWLAPLPGLPREAILAAGLGAGVGVHVARAWSSGQLCRAVPLVAAPDVVAMLIVPAAAAWTWLPYLAPASPGIAASVWGKEWDISSHSHIVWTMLHTDELLLYAPPAPDGSPVAFANYPATFHSVAASLIRLWRGASPLTGMDAVVAFNLAIGLLACLAAVLAAASVACLPAARRHPWWGCVGAGAVASVMLTGPGSIPLVNGHYNFQFAVALTLGLLAVALVGGDALTPRHLAVLASGVAVVSGTWLPLTAVTGIACLGLVPSWRAWRVWPRAHRWVALGVVGLALAFCVLQLAWTIGGTPGDAVNTPGGIERVLPLQTTGAAFVLMLALATGRRRPGATLREDRAVRRAWWGALAIAVFLAAAGAVAVAQLVSFGEVRYYAMKLQSGGVDLTWAYLPAVALVLADAVCARAETASLTPTISGTPSTRSRRARSYFAALLAGTVSIGTWGVVGSEPLLGVQQPQSAAWVQRAIGPRPELVKAIAAAERVPPRSMVLVLTGVEQERNALDSLMVAAVRGTYSNDTNHWINSLFADRSATAVDLALANRQRIREGNVVVVAAPELVRTLKLAVPDAPRDAIRSYEP